MTIERPDWSGAAAVPVPTSGDPLGALTLQREMETWQPGADVTSRPAGSDLGPAAHPSGLGHALIGEMARTVEGLDANLQLAGESVAMLEAGFVDLGVDAGALNAELAKCPQAMRDKIVRMAWKNPGIHVLDFLDRLEREQFTLEEQHLAEQALRRLRGAKR